MVFRFIHTADLQIGKGFGQFPAEVSGTLRAQRLETLKRIAILARDRSMDAVFAAGDCFDDIAVSDETLRRFKIALEPFDGAWVLLPGNHDPAIAESPWTRLKRLSLPPNVIIADQPEPILIGKEAVVLPAPLRRRRDAADLTDWFDSAQTDDGLIRIGLAHGSVQEFLPEASEAANPIALNRAQRARLDYLALGDWHGRLQVSDRTWYSGTPEPDRFKENDPGSVLIVEIDRSGELPRVEAVPVGAYRWLQRQIDLSPGGSSDIRDMLPLAEDELARLVLRLALNGTVDLATRAAVDDVLGDIAARVLHVAIDDHELFIEPSDDDLDSIDTAGFVRVAMKRLRENVAGQDISKSRRALALLYGLHRQNIG